MLEPYRHWRPDADSKDEPFELACSVSGPASQMEIRRAWPDRSPVPEAVRLWEEAREAELFRDVESGQWGLHLLPPFTSARFTKREAEERPGDFRESDMILGEFLGDQDLLVVAPSEQGDRRILIALPLDPREEWYGVGASLDDFFRDYLNAQGDKFWE